MKTLTPLCLLLAFGCAPKSEFDISPAQAKAHRPGAARPMDPKNLPPGAVREERVFHKGDTLPDGTISDGERKYVTVKIKK